MTKSPWAHLDVYDGEETTRTDEHHHAPDVQRRVAKRQDAMPVGSRV